MESLTEENEDTRKIVVEFQHAESINRFRLVGSNISLRTTECDHCFKWIVDRDSFEVIHGLYRIVLMLPQKLGTAIIINLQDYQDREEDGTYLVCLVIELLKTYLDMVKEVNPPRFGFDVSRFCLSDHFDHLDPMIEQDLGDVIACLYSRLEAFVSLLKDRSDQIFPIGKSICRMADNIKTMCHVYIEFVHQLWVKIGRSGVLDLEEVQLYRARAINQIVSSFECLSKEFSTNVLE